MIGVPEDRFVYLHGGADVKERTVMERLDLSRNPAALMACQQALDVSSVSLKDISFFDLYSCFPIAVFNICDGLGLAPDDPRGLTLTGGLPFFGGAGNNYSMHAIASMARAVRDRPGSYGLVGANGGFLSKYSVGVYSTRSVAWRGFDSADLQAEIDSWRSPAINPDYVGEAKVETYTIDYAGAAPRGVIIGRTPDGARVAASVEDEVLVRRLIDEEPLGGSFVTAPTADGKSLVSAFAQGQSI